MEKIDCNKIQRILDIKNDFENETINSTIILPEYIECINTIYDTELKNFPLFCPKCKKETLVNVVQQNITLIKEPDAKMQS